VSPIGSSLDEEHRLLYLLGEFDVGLAKDCVHRALGSSSSQSLENLLKPRWIKGRKTGKPIAYRAQLKTPCYFILSHPLSRFRRLEPYWIGYEDANFCAKLGLIPAFMVNLNKFTLLRLWGEMAQKLFSPTAEPIPEEGYVHWKLEPAGSRGLGRLPELSSMNFVLKQNADMKVYEGEACECLEDYFIFGFWAFPERGFSDSTIVINDDAAVHLVLKASKSVYIPGKTYTKPMDLGLEKQMPVEMVTLLGVTREQTQYRLQKIEDVVLTKDVARSLEDERCRGRFFINGVISEFRKRERKFPTLTTVALYEVSNFELYKSLIGLVVSQRFENIDALSRVGKLEDIEEETEQILKLLLQKAALDRTIADSFPDLFSLALKSLSPIVTTDEADVFYMHPSVFVALLEYGRIDFKRKQQDLVNVLKLLDMIPESSNADILRSEESVYLRSRGLFPELILSYLRPAAEQIYLARILKSRVLEISGDAMEKDVFDSSSKKAELPARLVNHKALIDVSTEKEQEIFRHLREEEKKLRKAQRDR